MKEIEENFKNNEIETFYQELTNNSAGFKNRNMYCQNREGLLLLEPEKVMDRWREYLTELLNVKENSGNLMNIENDQHDNEEISIEKPYREEVETIIRSLKDNKRLGQNQISAEMIKNGGAKLQNLIYTLIEVIWEKETMPKDWWLICLLLKKGHKTKCENYRGIGYSPVYGI